MFGDFVVDDLLLFVVSFFDFSAARGRAGATFAAGRLRASARTATTTCTRRSTACLRRCAGCR